MRVWILKGKLIQERIAREGLEFKEIMDHVDRIYTKYDPAMLLEALKAFGNNYMDAPYLFLYMICCNVRIICIILEMEVSRAQLQKLPDREGELFPG